MRTSDFIINPRVMAYRQSLNRIRYVRDGRDADTAKLPHHLRVQIPAGSIANDIYA